MRFLHYLQLLDVKVSAWMLAISAGFGVKIAFEVAEEKRLGRPLKKGYILINLCALFITFVIGFYTRALIKNITGNSDFQGGLFAVEGVIGFSLFRILYNIIINPALWRYLANLAINILAGKFSGDKSKEVITEQNEKDDSNSINK